MEHTWLVMCVASASLRCAIFIACCYVCASCYTTGVMSSLNTKLHTFNVDEDF